MFLTLSQHYQYIQEQIRLKPRIVLISSFGLYAGILDDGRDTNEWGPRYQKISRRVVDMLQDVPDVRFLIGIPKYVSCKQQLPCSDCEERYETQMRRLLKHQEKWPQFKWRYTTELHLKAYLFFFEKTASGVTGGRNFTDSEWVDATFPLSPKEVVELYDHLGKSWHKSLQLTEENLALTMHRQYLHLE